MQQLSLLVKQLVKDRNRLNQAIEALQSVSNGPSRKGGRHLSAAGRAKIIAAQKKRWRQFKATKKAA